MSLSVKMWMRHTWIKWTGITFQINKYSCKTAHCKNCASYTVYTVERKEGRANIKSKYLLFFKAWKCEDWIKEYVSLISPSIYTQYLIQAQQNQNLRIDFNLLRGKGKIPQDLQHVTLVPPIAPDHLRCFHNCMCQVTQLDISEQNPRLPHKAQRQDWSGTGSNVSAALEAPLFINGKHLELATHPKEQPEEK